VPFHPAPGLAQRSAGDEEAWAAAALVGRFVSEALAARDVSVVPPSDVEAAFRAQGVVVPRQDPAAAARVAEQAFGATAVLVGRVDRYSQRSGGEVGSTRPSSVSFRVALHAAPSGEALWAGLFDETQPGFSDDPLRAWRLPGGGMRWLSAAELARFGADQLMDSLVSRPWARPSAAEAPQVPRGLRRAAR